MALTDDHDPLCSIGVRAGDQTMPCDCRPFWQQIGIEQLISGGQTGADIGGLRAAVTLGIPTGGTAPDGFLNERHPQDVDFLLARGLTQNAIRGYTGIKARTASNVRNSNASLVFVEVESSGSRLTLRYCETFKRPVYRLSTLYRFTPNEGAPNIFGQFEDARIFLREHRPKILNIAGNRESVSPGIEARVEVFLRELLK